MGVIKKVERFICHSCGYITENPEQIKWIRKLGGKCPACGGKRKPTIWTSKKDEHIHSC